MKPYDLKSAADAGGYRTIYDPTSRIEPSRRERACLIRIPAAYGWIGVHSETELLAYSRTNRLLARFRQIPGAKHFKLGDKEFSVVFSPAALTEVATILRAQKRRTLSPETKARLAQMGFQPRSPRPVVTGEPSV
jgi:hypothetical protein